jgi:methionine-rich copper-binding protein CopC
MKILQRLLSYHLQLLCALVLNLSLLFITTGVTTTGVVLAHASVIGSIPKMNSTITLNRLSKTITVKTAENIKPGAANSNLFVYGPSGKLISQGAAIVSLKDPTQMSVAIKPDKTGVYTVYWKTVSANDGDPDEGAFGFLVASPPPPVKANSGVTATLRPCPNRVTSK